MSELTENQVRGETDQIHEIRKRFGLTREVVSDSKELLQRLNRETFAGVMPRPERTGSYGDRDEQSDDVKSVEARRSSLLVSVEEAGEILVPIEVDPDGNLLDGFRRVQIAQSLGIESLPMVILGGWRGDKQQVEALKFAYIREVNLTSRVLSLDDRRKLANQLLGEDERRFLSGEVANRQSYGLIACQTGLNQRTIEGLERDNHYLRYRARCEGEQRLRGDGRLRSTSTIPPEMRLDVRDAWKRGFDKATPRRTMNGLQEEAKKRRKFLETLSIGPDRRQKEALLEDAVKVLMPKMEAEEREQAAGKEKRDIEKKKQEQLSAQRDEKTKQFQRKQLVESFLGDCLIKTVAGESRSLSFAALLGDKGEVDLAIARLAEGATAIHRSALSLDQAGELDYTEEELTSESFQDLVREARESRVIISGDCSRPIRDLSSEAVLHSLIEDQDGKKALVIEARLGDRVVARDRADTKLLLRLHRELKEAASAGKEASGHGIPLDVPPDLDQQVLERPDRREVARKDLLDPSMALSKLADCCRMLGEVATVVKRSGWATIPVDEWTRLTASALDSIHSIRRRIPDCVTCDWSTDGF